MHRVSSAPEDARSPFHDVAQKIAKYVEQDSGEIDSIYCEQNNKGLLFAVQGDRERRYLFCDLDGASKASSPESFGEGEGLYSFDALAGASFTRPEAVRHQNRRSCKTTLYVPPFPVFFAAMLPGIGSPVTRRVGHFGALWGTHWGLLRSSGDY